MRTITVLRVAAPDFEIAAENGQLVPSDGAPVAIAALVGVLKPDSVVWSNTRVFGGPDGIVAFRSGIDGVETSFAYDLWLLERIAGALELTPLVAKGLGPSWKVPYGLGRSTSPDSG